MRYSMVLFTHDGMIKMAPKGMAEEKVEEKTAPARVSKAVAQEEEVDSSKDELY